MTVRTISIVLAGLAMGCILRSTDDYRSEVQALLDTREGAILACYDAAREGDADAAGDVVVNFKVNKKTGSFTDPTLVADRSSAPAPVAECVTSAIGDLVLDPGDMANADATFTWTFKGP